MQIRTESLERRVVVPHWPARRVSAALGALLIGAAALIVVSCAPVQPFSPLFTPAGALRAPLAPVPVAPVVSVPVETTTEVVVAAPEPAPEPELEPVVEVALPRPGGTTFIPVVERWRGPVREMIEEARAEGRLSGRAAVLNEDLVLAVIQQESAGDPDAQSWAGALGLMQLMPPSFAWIMGIRNWGQDVSDIDPAFIRDPHTNLRAGVRFLAAVLEEQSGSVYWALASYNAGGGAVNAWRAAGLTDVPAIGGYVETANYVPAVLSSYNAHRP